MLFILLGVKAITSENKENVIRVKEVLRNSFFLHIWWYCFCKISLSGILPWKSLFAKTWEFKLTRAFFHENRLRDQSDNLMIYRSPTTNWLLFFQHFICTEAKLEKLQGKSGKRKPAKDMLQSLSDARECQMQGFLHDTNPYSSSNLGEDDDDVSFLPQDLVVSMYPIVYWINFHVSGAWTATIHPNIHAKYWYRTHKQATRKWSTILRTLWYSNTGLQ